MPILISVVVCTYNRATLLVDVVQNLCQQSLERSFYEVIIVDNNSTDDTRTVVEQFADYKNVRYYFEPQQGLSYARNRGWQLAQGEYVAYFDDDCKIPTEWLEVAKEVIGQIGPAVIGGPAVPFYNTHKPKWFKDSYQLRTLGDKTKVLEHEYLYGNNMCFRRTLLETLGGFDPSLGMSGQKIAYGEEIALQQLIRNTMPDELIYYDPRLYIYDLVRPEKMHIPWLVRQRFAAGRYSYRMFPGTNSSSVGTIQVSKMLGGAVFRVLAFGVDLGRAVLLRDCSQYPYPQNYLYERTFEHLNALGRLYEQAVSTIVKAKQ